MSLIIDTIKNKNKVERLRQARHKYELKNIKEDSEFSALMRAEFKKIEKLFQSDEIDTILIDVDNKYLARFSAIVYSAELADYDISQVDGFANRFYIRRKFIAF